MAIGETVLGAVLQVVIDRLASKDVIDFFRHSKIDQNLVDQLMSLMYATEKLILDAEYKFLTDPAVKHWLEDLKHWFYRAEEVVDQIATEARLSSIEKEFPSAEPQSFGSKVRNFIPAFTTSSNFHNTVNLNIKEIIDMLERKLRQKDALGLRELSLRQPPPRGPTTSLMGDTKVYGRDLEKDKILESLLSEKAENFSVVSIVGMGGIGKTTLAKQLYNHKTVEETFELKAWVCVSDPFDIIQITKSILESVAPGLVSDSSELNTLQNKLSGVLSNKKFFIVLDDVWSEKYEDWETLRAPFCGGARGSKVMVTARNEGVSSTMSTDKPFPLKPLSDDDAWSLFSRHAFADGNMKFDSCLEPIGRKIIQKCKGLPLAIKTLGSLLRGKRNDKDWEEVLESSIWDLPLEKSNVVPALWLSYYHLPGHLKRCFSFCAIFPKDRKIDRKQLVLLWMAKDFVQPTRNKREIEDVGVECLCELISRSFLEPMNASQVTMHDLMHDLAQEVSGNFLARPNLQAPSMFAQRASCQKTKFTQRARHFSFVVDSNHLPITKFQAIDETIYLRSFIPLQMYRFVPFLITNAFSTILKPSLLCLRVLAIPGYKNPKLLELIGFPKHLRYLDISYSTIKHLPEWMTKLCSLQTLILSGCRHLERLPVDMWRLVSLRHLDIRGATELSHMPTQISKLNSLQTLTDFVVGKNTGSAGIQELRELPHIKGRLAIRNLHNVDNPSDAYHVDLSSRGSIDALELEFDSKENNDSEKERNVLENLKPPANLKRLTIRDYAGTRFPKWLGPGCVDYMKMTFLCLSGCPYCIKLPPLGQLPSLRELKIEEMDLIVNVGHEFYGHGNRGIFPALETLSFKKMNNWEVWSNVDAEGAGVCFPRLKKLSLFKCLNLKGNLPVHVPSLVILKIHGCVQLSRVLPGLASVEGLKVATCPRAELASAFDLTSITTLRLHSLVHLVKLPPMLDMLSSLNDLRIEDCDNLKSLANVKLPSKLESLAIEDCKVLESLPHDMESISHLRDLMLVKCGCLVWASGSSCLPTSLHCIEVDKCERWEFPITMERMQRYTNLENISLEYTSSHIVSFPLGVFPNLRSLSLRCCKGLERVYIQQDIDDKCLTSLTYLFIKGCEKLEMVGKETGRGEVTVLPAPNLTTLTIRNCEKVKPVVVEMEGQVFLPSLQNLEIRKRSKVRAEWPLNIRRSLFKFSSLTYLRIEDEEVECIPESWGFLPPFLQCLKIRNCQKLRRLDGKALQTLTFLTRLSIYECPKLESLPEEGLPPSLGDLSISGCPMVEERCQPEKGKDYSKIHHIPEVFINNRDIWKT